MTVLAPYILCDLAAADYDEVLTLWQRAGLHIRQEGRDGPESFARLSNLGYQRVIGMRAPAGSQAAGSAPAPLVAVALLTHDGRKGWINRLAVDPAHRRRGLAQRLVAEAERWFQEDVGLEVWAALIEAANAPSRALFTDLGYGQADVVYVSKRTRPDA